MEEFRSQTKALMKDVGDLEGQEVGTALRR